MACQTRRHPCPTCSSGDVRLARQDERGRQFFVIYAPRVCESCGARFLPKAGFWMGGLVCLLVIVTAACAARYFVWPAVADLLTTHSVRFSKVVLFLFGLLGLYGCWFYWRVGYRAAADAIKGRRQRPSA